MPIWSMDFTNNECLLEDNDHFMNLNIYQHMSMCYFYVKFCNFKKTSKIIPIFYKNSEMTHNIYFRFSRTGKVPIIVCVREFICLLEL